MKRAVLLFALFFCVEETGFCASGAPSRPSAQASPEGVYIPLPGSTERKALLDVMRREIRKRHHLDVVFVVRNMRVCGEWAWVGTLPESPDGTNHYEDFSALLRKTDGVWVIVDIPGGGSDDDASTDGVMEYYNGLKDRFPGLPAAIFPLN